MREIFFARIIMSIIIPQQQLRLYYNVAICWVDRRGLPGISILGMRLVLLCSGGQGVGLGGRGGDNTSLIFASCVCWSLFLWILLSNPDLFESSRN